MRFDGGGDAVMFIVHIRELPENILHSNYHSFGAEILACRTPQRPHRVLFLAAGHIPSHTATASRMCEPS